MGIKPKSESMFIQGLCIKCGLNKQARNGTRKGIPYYRPVCSRCHSGKPQKKFDMTSKNLFVFQIGKYQFRIDII